MSISTYLNSLKQKHNTFKKHLKETLNNYVYDEITIKNLKKQKLLIKERISKIEIQQPIK